jgi:hypothetical protein
VADEDALNRVRMAVDEIADVNDARVDRHQLDDGTWIVSIEHDDWAVSASGFSEAQAFSQLIKNAKAEGRAN